MFTYLYRRPDNSAAADTFEKIGRTFLMGCDLFAENVVTYYNQEIITRHPSQNSLLSKIWNVAKLPLAPLGVLGVFFLESSYSYAELTQNISKYGVKDEDEAIHAIWTRLHGFTPLDREKIGSREIWDYAEEMLKNQVQQLGIPPNRIRIDRESGEIEIVERFSVPNVPVGLPEPSIPKIESYDELQRKIFILQLGQWASRVKKDPGTGFRGKIKRELLKNPHRIFILLTQDSFSTKQLGIAYIDQNNSLRVSKHTFTSFDIFEEALQKVLNKRGYSLRLDHAQKFIETYLNLKQAVLLNRASEFPGLEVNPRNYRYELNCATASGISIAKHYPLDMILDTISVKITEDITAMRGYFEQASSSDEFIVNENFLREKGSQVAITAPCGVDNLINAILNVAGTIPDSDSKSRFYRVFADRLCYIIETSSHENWSAFVEMFQCGDYSVDQFLEFLENLNGQAAPEILYALHREKKKRTQTQPPSIQQQLLQQRDRAAEMFIEQMALQYDCSEDAVRRALINQGLGLDAPIIQTPPTSLPPLLQEMNLLTEFQRWLTPERLYLHTLNFSFDETNQQFIKIVTDSYFTQEPYFSEITSAKENFAQTLTENLDKWDETLETGRQFLQSFGSVQPPNGIELHPMAIELGQMLNGSLNILKNALPGRKTDLIEAKEYRKQKDVLLQNARDTFFRLMHQQMELLQQGELGEQFYHPIRLRILEENGLVDGINLTQEALKRYLTFFA